MIALDLSGSNTGKSRTAYPGVGRGNGQRGERYATRGLAALAMQGGSGALATPKQSFAEWGFKRMVDIVMATLLLVLNLPVMALIALLIKCTSRGDVIFRQPRVGCHGQEFTMYKFRTMRPDAAAQEEQLANQNGDRVFLKIKDDPRVTRVGRFLRKYSLDELPQLFNVLRGDMSLVGPRPLLPCDMWRFPGGRSAQRFTVPPGITGLWQVSGRSRCSDEERIRLDLEYVERWSPWLDLWILLQTPLIVLLAKGAH